MRSSLRVNKQCCWVLLINRSPVKGAVSGPERSNVSCLRDRSSRNVRKQTDGATPCGQVVDPRAPLSRGPLKNGQLHYPLPPWKAVKACVNTESPSSDTLRVRDKISMISPNGIIPFPPSLKSPPALVQGEPAELVKLCEVFGEGRQHFGCSEIQSKAWIRVQGHCSQ